MLVRPVVCDARWTERIDNAANVEISSKSSKYRRIHVDFDEKSTKYEEISKKSRKTDVQTDISDTPTNPPPPPLTLHDHTSHPPPSSCHRLRCLHRPPLSPPLYSALRRSSNLPMVAGAPPWADGFGDGGWVRVCDGAGTQLHQRGAINREGLQQHC